MSPPPPDPSPSRGQDKAPLINKEVILRKSALHSRLVVGDAPLTFAVLQHSFHGALPLAVPAHLGGAGQRGVVGVPALPQVHLHAVVQEEEGCGRGRGRTVSTLTHPPLHGSLPPSTLPYTHSYWSFSFHVHALLRRSKV